jgi:phenylacetate-CoA ligase
MHLNEKEFIFEVVDPSSGEAATDGELVVTNLGRVGMPAIRYRTGDRVRLHERPCACGRPLQRLEGGVVGRLDDALIIRGMIVYPSTVENVVRRFSAVGEFAVEVYRREALDELKVRVELARGEGEEIAPAIVNEFRHSLGLRVEVEIVPRGSLPRFEFKARRVVDLR